MQCETTNNRGGPCNGQWFTDMEILKDGFQEKKGGLKRGVDFSEWFSDTDI